MRTYRVHNAHLLDRVVLELRSSDYAAHVETFHDEPLLCTNAPQLAIGLASGDGLWAEFMCDGLPTY